jgi:dihydroorotase
MTCELLQQVRVLDPVTGSDRVADVLIEDGVVGAIADALTDYPADTSIHNCQGLILGPGLIDLYSHASEPGFEARETLESLMQAGAAGGFTQIAVLPATAPPLDNPATISWLMEKVTHLRQRKRPGHHSSRLTPPASPSAFPHLHCWAALTTEARGQQMTDLADLATAEIVGFADGNPVNNLPLLRRLLEYLNPLGKPIALWACDLELAGNGVMREGPEAIRFGLAGVPAMAETVALSALLECVETTGTPVHLMRVSTARSVDLIRLAKARGLPITASTSWMHLLLNSEAVGSYDPNLRLNPPLGNSADQEALINGLQTGILDAIAIDHTPYTYEEKTVAFAEAPPGAIGLELALPLLWQALVETNRWTPLELWRCLSLHPARCLHQQPGAIAVGKPAELTLYDPHYPWVIDGQSLRSLSRNTPWFEQPVTGRVLKTWCD